MKECLGVVVLISVILTSEAIVEDGKALKYQPALAMRCGKCTKHRDTETGEWISDASGITDCMESQEEMLAYCKEVYPSLSITNVIEEAESAHVSSWCRIGSKEPCGGHPHNVKPITCVVGEYKPEALEVDMGCSFEHTHDYDACHTSTYWEDKAGSICHGMGKTVTKPRVLTACDEVDHWQGVEYLCCDSPSLPKPKRNKGKAKEAPEVDLKPANIETIDKGSVAQVCSQPAKIGVCRAYIPRWHFNQESKKCEVFHWGGCGGNDNNFETEEECEKRCPTEKTAEPADQSMCGLPSVTGPCRAMFERFAYDVNTGKCKMFVFGGCMGNDNNFEDEETCEASCKGYKNPKTGPIQIEPPMKMPLNPILNLGPVITDMNMPTVPPIQVSTVEPSTTTEQQPYTDSTTIANEHDVFADKLKEIQSEHQDKVAEILSKYDADNDKLSPDSQEFQQLKEDLDETIATLEDDYDAKMSSLNEFHKNRMNKMITDERAKTLGKFLKQLKSANPKVRHILISLEKYIAVEKQDKDHVMQHYFMAVNDNFDEASVSDFKNQLNEIDARVNKTRTVLSNYPDIFKKIQEDVEDILSTMPPSPDFDQSYDDYDDYEIYEDDVDEDVIDPTPTGIIDEEGIPDPDDVCSLPMVVGLCRASMMRYYYDKNEKACKVFYYGGCGGNENSFFTLEECQTACITKPNEFDDLDVNGVLDSEVILPRTHEFDDDVLDSNDIDFSLEDAANAQENKQINDLINNLEGYDDNYILTSVENEIENENFLDSDVDSRFSYNGDPIDVDGPSAVIDQYKAASMSQHWAIWFVIGIVVLVGVVVIVVVARRYNTRRPPMTISVEKPEDGGRELSPEEKQLLSLQQNGYENPTYKFFEKQMA